MMNVIEFLRAKRDVEGLKELMSTLLEPETRPNTLDYYLGANCAKYIQVKNNNTLFAVNVVNYPFPCSNARTFQEIRNLPEEDDLLSATSVKDAVTMFQDGEKAGFAAMFKHAD